MLYRRCGNSCCLDYNEKINFGYTSKRCCSSKKIKVCVFYKKFLFQEGHHRKKKNDASLLRELPMPSHKTGKFISTCTVYAGLDQPFATTQNGGLKTFKALSACFP